MKLRHYSGDVSELALNFTATCSLYGQVCAAAAEAGLAWALAHDAEACLGLLT